MNVAALLVKKLGVSGCSRLNRETHIY